MKRRGKVLRELNSSPGLLMIDGQQFRFALEGVWRSEAPPKPGLNVEVELDHNLQVSGITVIPDSQIAREHAQAAVAKAEEKEVSRRLGTNWAVVAVIATALLLVGSFLLTR